VVLLPAGALYGHPASRDLPVKEAELTPRGVRGVVARAVVDLLTHYREQHSIEFTALAAATVYGPRQRADGGVVAALCAAAASGATPSLDGGGRQTRDFVFVDDVVDAMVRATGRGSGLVINVGTGQQTAIRDIWTRLDPTGRTEVTEGPTRRDDLLRFAVSPVRARIHLGWSPWTELDQGLAAIARNAN
jgi:UDP-glucose 4-epimerase